MWLRTPLVGRGALVILGVLLLVFALAFGAPLTACGGPENEEASDAPNTTVQAAQKVSGKKPANVARAAAAEIDEASIRASLAQLTGVSPAPLSSGPITIAQRGSEEGRRAAAQYIKESFEEMGVPARILEFGSDYGRGYNVEATLEGTEGKKHLWVTAHLDSFFNAGANDDASGLVSILMTAKALKQLNPKQTVHFVAYDLEEVGLIGSAIYEGSTVSAIREQEGEQAIIGDIHTDMIGYDDGDSDAVMVTCGRAGPIDEAVLRASETIDSPIKLGDDCQTYSDHQHFWTAGLPAVLMIESTAEYDYYPWYHEPGDTMDKVDVPYLRSMIQLNAATAALLAASESGS